MTSISPRLLLSLYLIIPISLATYYIDAFFFGHSLVESLPRAPESYFLVSIFLGSPHIVASNLLLVTNQDYWSLYSKRVIMTAVLIGLGLAIGNFLLPYKALFAIIASWTVLHVVKQQLGIGNGFYRLSKTLYRWWCITIISLGTIIYNIIFLGSQLPEQVLSVLNSVAYGLAIIVVVLTIIAHTQAPTRFGRMFLWANAIMILASFWMFYERCFFFTILIPRFIHDVTAFIFYSVHDHNKHRTEPQNRLHHFARRLRVPALIIAPLTAVLLTLTLKKAFDPTIKHLAIILFDYHRLGNFSFFFFGFLALIHYYTESFTWTTDSPYRKFIRFGKI